MPLERHVAGVPLERHVAGDGCDEVGALPPCAQAGYCWGMKKLSLLALVALAASCTYDPAFELACSNEGEVDGDRRCWRGVWVTADAGTALPDAGPALDASGGFDAGQDAAEDPDAACSPESDDAFCARFGLTCNDVTEVDTCGNMRTVNCGTCTGSATCGGGGTPNVCACPGQTDIDFCAQHGKTCDPFTAVDECGEMRTVNCGTCSGLLSCGSDNTCACEPVAACTALGKNCGTVAVTGQCGDTTMVECGACAADGVCGDDNVCACNDGFTGDGKTCADIDECADGTHDCDLNATCTNNAGSFVCACNAGYQGDGKSCSLVPVSPAKSVQSVAISFADGETSKSATIAAVDATQTVPFVTRRVSGISDDPDELDRMGIDVTVTGPTQVTVTRDDGAGASVVEISVVEFDPTAATVQSGTFSTANTTVSAPLGTVVDPAKTFLVFYGYATADSEARRGLFVAGSIAATGDAVDFERHTADGSVGGTWWVVEAVGTAFSVQHLSSNLDDLATSRDLAISTVATDKSLVLYSLATDHSLNDNYATNIGCRLETSTNVECRRFQSVNNITELNVQVVTFATTPVVYRGTVTLVADLESNSAPIGATVGADATAFGGALGLAGMAMSSTRSGEQTPGGFFTQRIDNAGTNVQIRRGSPRDSAAMIDWQVVSW